MTIGDAKLCITECCRERNGEMNLEMDISVFLAYTAGMLLLYFCGRLLFVPLKILLKLLACSLAGGVILIFFRILGGQIGMTIPVNPLNAVITGVCGVPGVLALILYFNL